MNYIVKDLLTLQEKRITSSEYELVMTYLEALKRFSYEIDYYKLVEISIKEYLLLQNKIRVNSYDNFVVLNSKYSNWLNAFYMWLQYHKKEYDYVTEDMIRLCTKENIVFNLARELRNYVIHDAFAISLISFDVLNEETAYLIKPNDILRDKTNSTLKMWLNDKITKNENIDSIICLRQFCEVFNELQFKIWNK